MYFLLLNHCSYTVQAKESTNDARADQFCFDDEEEDDDTCTDVPNCCSMESVVEAAPPSMQFTEKLKSPYLMQQSNQQSNLSKHT